MQYLKLLLHNFKELLKDKVTELHLFFFTFTRWEMKICLHFESFLIDETVKGGGGVDWLAQSNVSWEMMRWVLKT